MSCLLFSQAWLLKSKRGTGATKRRRNVWGWTCPWGGHRSRCRFPGAGPGEERPGRAGGGPPGRVAWPPVAVGAGILQGATEFTCSGFRARAPGGGWGLPSESHCRAIKEMRSSCRASRAASSSWLQLIGASFLPSSPRFLCPQRRPYWSVELVSNAREGEGWDITRHHVVLHPEKP